ncbi:MAG: lipopolysaccharide heptosyltransferase I [Rhodocyclales bacterium]|nr:lipopolysaccharide heptosyltransferase I [Rhodocyclales bacterium]
MRILLIKTSSLGDVVHNLPVVSDLRRRYPEAKIDWVVEDGFVDIPRLHPGLGRVIPVALRRWRQSLLAPATWHEIRSFRATLQEETYDLAIDTQGLLKSALITRMARGRRCGYAASSAREPLAARFYDATFDVATDLHAVERNRRLAALAGAYTASTVPDYGIAVTCPGLVCREFRFAGRQSGTPGTQSEPAPTLEKPHAVLLTATSRDDKLWPQDRWIAVGQALHRQGLTCQLPAGSTTERERAIQIAQAIPDAIVLPPMSLAELAGQLAAARIVIGVDTGLVHLAAALGRPTLALFCASDPTLTGVLAATPAINLGTRGLPPTVSDVLAAALPLL